MRRRSGFSTKVPLPRGAPACYNPGMRRGFFKLCAGRAAEPWVTLCLAAAAALTLLCARGGGAARSPVSAAAAEPFAIAFAEEELYCGGYRLLRQDPDEDARRALEDALFKYPDGFFDTIAERAGGLRFLLCGGIRGVSPECRAAPPALTAAGEDGVTLVFDCSEGVKFYTVCHEVCHAADAALQIPDSEWYALQPPGFRFLGRYTDEKGRPAEDGDGMCFTPQGEGEPYFVNAYAKTFPSEDRAVLFETLMRAGPDAGYLHSPHIIRKLTAYCALLRAGLDPDGRWDQPFWEARLYEVLKAERHDR